MILSIMTVDKMARAIIVLNITTLGIHCCSAVCRIVLLSYCVVMLSLVTLSVVVFIAVMLSAIMLSAIVFGGVA